MKAIGMAFVLVAMAGPAALAAYGQTPFDGGSPRKGRDFALQVCTPCHVVSARQISPPRFADAPAFSEIANARGMTATSLAAFLSSPHPSMPNLILSVEERRDVISYIISLQNQK